MIDPATQIPGVLIFGATGPTGTLVTNLLRERGIAVAAVLRSEARRGEFEHSGAEVLRADAMQPDSLASILESAVEGYPILLNLLGGNPFGEPESWPDYEGVRNVTEAAAAAGYRRYILVTSVGTGDSWQYADAAEAILKPIIELKSRAESHLKATALDWTILKPGGLGPPQWQNARGKALITENHGVRGLIDREDLADVILRLLEADSDTIRHRELYTVVDKIEHNAGVAQPFPLIKTTG